MPALFGLAALATFIYGIAAAIMRFVVIFLTVRTVIRLVFVGLVAASIYGSFQAVELLIDSVSMTAPSFIATPLTWILPTNFATCISVIVSAHVSTIVMRFYLWAMSVLVP